MNLSNGYKVETWEEISLDKNISNVEDLSLSMALVFLEFFES